jgi:exodeoxyribonuclease-3
MQLKIATWNINSVRLRIDLVCHFLKAWQPDVLCLQETKCPQGQFPSAPLRALGYEHLAESGQSGYHGVAIVSRLPLTGIEVRGFCDKNDCRHIAAVVGTAEQVLIHNLYVPAGGDEPDPEINVKFAHKLSFLDELHGWFGNGSVPLGRHAVVVGDLNVAPLENDVWSHKQLLKIVSHTPAETSRLLKAQAAGGWVDIVRHHVPSDQKLYTWWSYRARDWRASDRGRRLDHIWATPALARFSRGIEIVREARGWARPSDHVPVLATLDFSIETESPGHAYGSEATAFPRTGGAPG